MVREEQKLAKNSLLLFIRYLRPENMSGIQIKQEAVLASKTTTDNQQYHLQNEQTGV